MTAQTNNGAVATSTEPIQYEVDDQVATIWLNRPEVKNCVNWALLTQLGEARRARPRTTLTCASC